MVTSEEQAQRDAMIATAMPKSPREPRGSRGVPRSTVPRVPNKRAQGLKMVTFWLPEVEHEAAKSAATELDTTVSDECRRALRNMIRRAEKKREAGQ